MQLHPREHHVMLCGSGRGGRQVAADLRREGAPLVSIDVTPASLQPAAEAGVLVVHGTAAADAVLAPVPDDLRREGGEVVVVAGTDQQLRELELACSSPPATRP